MRIFLSSTTYDLYDVRAFVIHELEKDGHEVVYHENATFPVHFGHSHDECLEAVKKCDVVVCIVDRRYGGRYKGIGAPYITNQTIEIRQHDESGRVLNKEITIPVEQLSISWCELITAFEHKMPVMTFARKRMLDEKETRRRNQNVTDFLPAYVENNRVFDFVDWITKQQRSNWVAAFDSIVDLRSMLLRWSAAVKNEFVVNREAKDDVHSRASHIAILVEGELDRKFVRGLVQKLNLPNFFAISTGGGSTLVHALRAMIEPQHDQAYDKLIVLADADLIGRFSLLQERLKSESKVHLVFASPALEAWMTAGLDPAFYTANNGRISRKEFDQRFGKKARLELDSLIANYDIEVARKLVPEFDRFITLISGDENGV
ncbi:DUF4062 domain-containing protein [Massilia sp. LjRoot122]|uniref:DUF4062 domain-containing protein n=1 Tax=Massilia sp. LjRoot122 TaxID=3342257 RepID=UPI003ECF01A8